ncbi:hypothetical protein D6D01_00698 [Aureobasidium pullulans]|uniref:Uncharacterized protein n=1 Tax=Aureobasidium pullulans TaxID=5580 RepID=A0A4S9M1V8_AURPU|nr:hypothetical protein D6D01_00698 [Aureobasidium pullulans]
MTVLGEQETTEITRKVEALASTLLVPDESPDGEWKQHFRIDTDLQGIRSLLTEKRTRLPHLHLPDWHQNEVLHALTLVEMCVKKMEMKHTRSVATDAVGNLTFVDGDGASYVFSVVKESVTAVMNSTLDEIRRGEVLAGAPASALQIAVGMVARQDILDAVFQRANLEALGSEVAIKKHVVAALANSKNFVHFVSWKEEGRSVLAEAIIRRRTSLMLSSVLAINKHSINNLTLNFIMSGISPTDDVNQVRTKIKAHYYQLDGSMLMSLDPRVFEDQARKEASTIVFANVGELPEDMAAELQENTHT